MEFTVSELADPPEDFRTLGRDLLTGLPKEISVNYKEIAHALDRSIAQIEQAILDTLAATPPELAADIYKTGIYLAGGGGRIPQACTSFLRTKDGSPPTSARL